MRSVRFEPKAYNEYSDWAETNLRILKKINELIKEMLRSPYEGKGNPEALKHQYSGYWSRKINNEHRIIYKVSDTEIQIISCMGHYSK